MASDKLGLPPAQGVASSTPHPNGRGGKRRDAGRKRKWSEPMMLVRIPRRMRRMFYLWLDANK